MKTPIFNPLTEDITVLWDSHGKNPKKFVFPAKEITQVDEKYAEHVVKHLLDRMFDKLGSYKKDREMQLKQFRKEIEV